MLGQAACEIDHVVDYIFSEDDESALNFLIKCLFLSQRLRNRLEVNGMKHTCRLLGSLMSDGAGFEARGVERSIGPSSLGIVELNVELLLLLRLM